MDLETLAAPFAQDVERGDADELTETLATSPQQSETGGTDGIEAAAEAGADSEDDAENVVEALAAADQERVEELVRLVDRHQKIGRLPQHVSEWEKEALALTGADDLDAVRSDLAETH